MRDLRIEVGAAFARDAHGIDDSLRVGALQTVGVGAGGERGEHFVLEIDHRHDDDVRRRQLGAHASWSASRRRSPGIPMSMTATSGRSRAIASQPVRPSAASATTSNEACSAVRKPARVSA